MWDEKDHPRDSDGKFAKKYSTESFQVLSTKELKNLCTSDPNDRKIKLPDIQIGRSLGAKYRNYEVMDLSTGEKYKFTEGSRLQDVEVFCGYGTKNEYRDAYKYADKVGGLPEEWQHVKAIGEISTSYGSVKVEVHWSRHPKFGSYDFFIKEWLE